MPGTRMALMRNQALNLARMPETSRKKPA